MMTTRNAALSLIVVRLLLSSMFVVKRHESLHGKKGNTKVLAGGYDGVAKDLSINIRAGGIVLFKFLHHGVVDNITRYFDGFVIGILRGTDNNVCQKSTKFN